MNQQVETFLSKLAKQRKDFTNANAASAQVESNASGASGADTQESSSATSAIFSGLARTVTSGGKQLLEGLGMIGSNKRTIQIDYLKKVLQQLEHQALLPQGEFYYDLGIGQSL